MLNVLPDFFKCTMVRHNSYYALSSMHFTCRFLPNLSTNVHTLYLDVFADSVYICEVICVMQMPYAVLCQPRHTNMFSMLFTL